MAMQLMRRHANQGSDAGRRYQMRARSGFSLARRLGTTEAESKEKKPSAEQAERHGLLQKEEEAGTLLRRLSHKGGERRSRPRPVERKAKAGGWLQVLEEQASPTGPGARRRTSPR